MLEVLTKFFRTEPNVVIIRDLVDGEMVEFLCEQIPDDRLIISTIRARDCANALLQVLALGRRRPNSPNRSAAW